jgi:hypothetical protein
MELLQHFQAVVEAEVMLLVAKLVAQEDQEQAPVAVQIIQASPEEMQKIIAVVAAVADI